MKNVTIVLILLLASVFTSVSDSQSQTSHAVVNGQLLARSNNLPAPGLLVSLVHPSVGRSVPSTTDVYGRFAFFGIPLNREPYYMEVYWGSKLIYRQTIFVTSERVDLPALFM